MYDLRKYKCSNCNKTFPVNEKLSISDDSTGFYCPHCMEAIQEPLSKIKAKDKFIILRLVFFILFLASMFLVNKFEESVLIYSLHVKLEYIFYSVFTLFLIIGVALFYFTKKYPPIINTEKINT